VFDAVALQLPIFGVSVERLIVLLIAAFAGGMFGASIGALPSFIFTGFVVLLGETAQSLVGEITEAGGLGAELATGITGTIGFGPVTGPHIVFAAGVAASAYAGKNYPELEPEGWDYHFGKNILRAFGTRPDILLVGGVFGVLGLLIARISGGIGLPLDGVALSVMTTAIIARPVFGYPIVGSPAGSGYLDMTPFENEQDRGDGSGRLATEPWLPQQYKWVGVTVIGVAAGILGAWTWLITGTFFLAYGVSAASLLFLQLGVEDFPVTHHITLGGSSFAAVAGPMAGGSEVVIIIAGLVGGVIGALLGEVTQRVMYAHSGTHVDPPAMAITIYSLAIGVLFLVGAIPNSAYLGLG
jgi:MFS family permease